MHIYRNIIAGHTDGEWVDDITDWHRVDSARDGMKWKQITEETSDSRL